MIVSLIVCPSTFSRTDVLFRPLHPLLTRMVTPQVDLITLVDSPSSMISSRNDGRSIWGIEQERHQPHFPSSVLHLRVESTFYKFSNTFFTGLLFPHHQKPHRYKSSVLSSLFPDTFGRCGLQIQQQIGFEPTQ